MNWFFLSAVTGILGNKEGMQIKVSDICCKKTKFNEQYMRDKSKTEKLYGKFLQTRAYKNFLSSPSLSNCFN
jgi:hypothetical protein